MLCRRTLSTVRPGVPRWVRVTRWGMDQWVQWVQIAVHRYAVIRAAIPAVAVHVGTVRVRAPAKLSPAAA
jgi:hypothetical protein